MPPLEEGPIDEQTTERPVLGGDINTNIFTSRLNNTPKRRGSNGSNIAPRESGLLKINNNLS